MIPDTIGAVGIFIALLALYFFSCVRIVFEYERGVVFRLGRVLPQAKGPGLMLIFWPIDRLVRVTLRTIVRDVPAQDVITRDNVSVKVNAVVYYRVVEPLKSVRKSRISSSPRASSPRRPSAAFLARRSSMICSRIAKPSTAGCANPSTIRPTRGASRCPRSR